MKGPKESTIKKSIEKRYWTDGKDSTDIRYELVAEKHIMFTQGRMAELCTKTSKFFFFGGGKEYIRNVWIVQLDLDIDQKKDSLRF